VIVPPTSVTFQATLEIVLPSRRALSLSPKPLAARNDSRVNVSTTRFRRRWKPQFTCLLSGARRTFNGAPPPREFAKTETRAAAAADVRTSKINNNYYHYYYYCERHRRSRFFLIFNVRAAR